MTLAVDSPAIPRARPLASPAPHLPWRIALGVSWQSICVRLSRSLVTVSSVVLAVAFLVVVVAGGIVDGAVHQRYLLHGTVDSQIQRLHDVLTRPRSTLVMIETMAEQPALMRSWSAHLLGTELPAESQEVYALLTRLAHWLQELTPNQRYLLTHNRDLSDWLLDLAIPEQASALIAMADSLPGTRLPLTREQVQHISAHLPRVRLVMMQLAHAEQLRLLQVSKTGGVEAVLDRLRQGSTLDDAGLPLDQILPDLQRVARVRLVRQLNVDHTRAIIMRVIDQINRTDWSLLSRHEVVDWSLLCSQLRDQLAEEGDTPARRLRAASSDQSPFTSAALDRAATQPQAQDALLTSLNSALTNSQLYGETAWNAYPTDPQVTNLLKQDRARLSERQITRLNRLLLKAAVGQAILDSPVQPIFDLDIVAQLDQTHTPAVARVHALLMGEVGETALREQARDLRARELQEKLARTFVSMGYDSRRSGERTFWLIVLALMVCTVGIVNSMTIAVSERFRDIATMKCLGAPDSFIVSSFLSEAAILGLFGATLGVVIGIAFVLTQERLRFGVFLWSTIPLRHLTYACAGALGCGLVLTIIGALLPARYAARLHPIEAMRVNA